MIGQSDFWKRQYQLQYHYISEDKTKRRRKNVYKSGGLRPGLVTFKSTFKLHMLNNLLPVWKLLCVLVNNRQEY